MENKAKEDIKNKVRFGIASDGFFINAYDKNGDPDPSFRRIRLGCTDRTHLALLLMRAILEENVHTFSYGDWQAYCQIDINRDMEDIHLNYYSTQNGKRELIWHIVIDLTLCMQLISILIPRQECLRKLDFYRLDQ